jgi:hypothetical protein
MSSTTLTAGTSIRRFPLWLKVIAVILIVVAVAFAAMTLRMNYAPTDLNLASTVMSANGTYQVSYTPELSPVTINQIQAWTITVTTPDGEPVDAAAITVDGGMPMHGHGLPTNPQITDDLGNGVYRVEGLKFNMPGWWQLKFEINHNDTVDTVTFDLNLN